jgi:hypothetical protein
MRYALTEHLIAMTGTDRRPDATHTVEATGLSEAVALYARATDARIYSIHERPDASVSAMVARGEIFYRLTVRAEDTGS